MMNEIGRPRVFALLVAVAVVVPGLAADRGRIAAINVGATSLVTLTSCVLQKHVHSVRDATRCLVAGGVAGAGFYQAKRLAARGDITEGWLVANAATSLVENTAAGEHPLGRIGYTFGPMRLRLVTPFDRKRESVIDVDVSAAETGYFARAIHDADDFDVRDGMLWYETRAPELGDGVVYHGYTWGIFPGVWRGADEFTPRHEAVHAVQSLQLDSIEPPLLTFHRSRRAVRLRHIRVGALNLADNIFNATVLDYEDRWAEIEAFRLTEDVEPPR